jgi:GT2 family glycosyltransferase
VTKNTPVPKDDPDITVVLVNYNTAHLFDRLFSSLAAARGDLKIQLIVVDNASRDYSAAILRGRYPDVQLIENATNVGFGRANNQALPRIRGRYLLLLNTDAFISPDTLAKTFNFMELNPCCGVLGVKLVGEDSSIQPCCRFFPTPWNVFLVGTGLHRFFPSTRLVDNMAWGHDKIRECDWVPGCYYLTRKTVIDQIGLFDPRFFLYYEEVDHCRRVHEAGWKVFFYPDTEVTHIGGESAKTDTKLTDNGRQIATLQIESELLYFRKYYGFLGLAASVLLTVCSSLMTTLKGQFERSNKKEAKLPKGRLVTIFSVLVATRFGSRPTR